MKKRQEIGRGLRLPVNQDGERIMDDTVNILTVVANESYEVYAANLQNEYREAGYDKIPPKVTRAHDNVARRNQRIFDDQNFQKFWQQLTHRSKYTIHVETDSLIQECINRVQKIDKRELNPEIVIETGNFVITKFTIKLEDIRKRSALLRIKIETSAGETFPIDSTFQVKENDDLAALRKDLIRLHGFRIISVEEAGDYSSVLFENDIRLHKGEETSFESETGQKVLRRSENASTVKRPIFNLIDRAAKETGITRKTIHQIFKGITTDYQEFFIKNPEGFANLFISALKETFSDHIVKNLEFASDPGSFAEYEIDEMFPPVKNFPQKELIEAGTAGLYDLVQIDSDVERKFVENYLSGNDPKVIGYFKFPPSYKINLPKLIGNYNPDWGILRYDDAGRVVLRLIRETKGREDTSMLRFSNEGRKIDAAKKHFSALGMDYRVVTDSTRDWYEPEYARTLREPRLPYGEE
jgi:type III restriction enzyme